MIGGVMADAGLVEFRHAGHDRRFVLHVPPAAGPGPAPLVLELHGSGIDPVRFDRMTGFRELSGEAGFVLAMPSAIGQIWNDGRNPAGLPDRPDDVGFLVALIDHISARVAVDPQRVHVVGMSNGATMAARLVCEHAERFAALAQVAGTAAIASISRPAHPVPIIQIHGAEDAVAPYAGGTRRGTRARLMIRRASGPSIGVDGWANFWVAANGATEGPEAAEISPDTTVRRWRGASPASDVDFYRVSGGGHTWPGSRIPLPRFLLGRTSRSFDATKVIWEFLAGHSRET
jgi:polyhydroxybutyrate depolymerase